MSRRWAVALGAGITFTVASAAGAIGNQLTHRALWAWVSFAALTIIGGVITVWLTWLSTTAEAAETGTNSSSNSVSTVSGADSSQVVGINNGTVYKNDHR